MNDQIGSTPGPPPGLRRYLQIGWQIAWHRRFAVLAVAAVLTVGGTGTALLLHKPGSRIHAQAVAYCGLIACNALPSGSATPRTTASDRARDRHPRRTAARQPATAGRNPAPPTSPAATPPASRTPRPRPSRTPSPSPSPSPTPTTAPAITDVTVTYTMPQQWYGGGFQGELTIVNHTNSALSSWQIVITMPNDHLYSVWNAEWQFGSGSSVTLTAASYDQVIEPGASQSVNFTGQGTSPIPTSCTFDGSACQPAPNANLGQGQRGPGQHWPGRHWPGRHHGPGGHGPGGHHWPPGATSDSPYAGGRNVLGIVTT
jgi:cellulose binding protein with CBM2 domain